MEFQEVIQSQGVYRPAFPSYRVFIYGQEITGDVVEVRVSQSGGSAERSAGGAVFTMINKFDKYVITHNDMKVIGTHRSSYKQNLDSYIKQTVQDSAYAFEFEYDIMQKVAENYGAELSDANAASLTASYDELSKGAAKDSGIDYENSVVPLFVKSEVVSRKQSFSQVIPPTSDSVFIKYESRVIWDYPYQEGDCIFHFNDPVRIAFRDPFNPQVWYWEFTGFVDTFTENSGTNKESLISISCTDVSKIPRNSVVQSKGYLGDEEIYSTTSNVISAQSFKEIFAGLTVHEVLEGMFFGIDSYLGSLTPFVASFVAKMSEEEIKQYLIQNMKKTADEVTSLVAGTQDFASVRKDIQAHMIESKKTVLGSRKDVGGILSPKGVGFRRASPALGVTAYFYGELDTPDSVIGKKIPNLYEWNNILHHQVRPVDLFSMSKDGKGPTSVSEMSDVSTIISTIGTDMDTYPVGGGRVFYFAPATLGSKLGNNVLDKEVADNVTNNSPFVDRLTLLYNLAERMDFRFYATPKGDLVFEMPFFDFDPVDFVKPGSLNLMNLDQDTAMKSLISRYDQIYKDMSYTGDYSEAVAQQLTSLALRAEEVSSSLYVGVFPDMLAEGFTIEPHEQISYSHTSTDEGMKTVMRCKRRTIVGYQGQDIDVRNSTASLLELLPLLGVRVLDDNVNGFIDTDEGAELWAAISLNKVNAEMRNVGVQTTPKFGLMVNRPIFWRARNFYGNIVSLTHSIMWNSGCETTINLNQLRGWGGETDEKGNPIHRHFANSRRPYDLAEMLRINEQAKR